MFLFCNDNATILATKTISPFTWNFINPILVTSVAAIHTIKWLIQIFYPYSNPCYTQWNTNPVSSDQGYYHENVYSEIHTNTWIFHTWVCSPKVNKMLKTTILSLHSKDHWNRNQIQIRYSIASNTSVNNKETKNKYKTSSSSSQIGRVTEQKSWRGDDKT